LGEWHHDITRWHHSGRENTVAKLRVIKTKAVPELGWGTIHPKHPKDSDWSSQYGSFE
jgi:hypothetical protein